VVSVTDSVGLEHTHLSTPEFTSKVNRVLFFGHVEHTRDDATDSAVGLLARVTQELSRQFMEELTHPFPLRISCLARLCLPILNDHEAETSQFSYPPR